MGNSSGRWPSWPGHASAKMKATQLPADWTPTEELRARAHLGECILIRGSALAQADLITREMRNCEVAWYWLGSEEDPVIIDDLYLPEQQTVSSAHVSISAEAVAAANRAVRREGKKIVGAGHSHHGFGVSTSMVDVELFGQLAQEGAGYRSFVWRSAPGCVSPAGARAVEHGTPAPADGRTEFRVAFDECPDTELLVTVPAGLHPQDLKLELKWRQTRLLSLFSTHDWYQNLHFPLLEVIRCGRCGTRIGERFLPPAVMLIIGPIALDAEQRRQTLAALEKRWPRRLSWAGSTEAFKRWTDGRADEDSAGSGSRCAAVTADPQPGGEGAATKPTPFEVYRQGAAAPVAVVEAAVLEEAAHRVPALGRALGWSDTGAALGGTVGSQSSPAGPTERPS